jgi:hypothetical protein
LISLLTFTDFSLKGRFAGRNAGGTAFPDLRPNFLAKNRNLIPKTLSERLEAGWDGGKEKPISRQC